MDIQINYTYRYIDGEEDIYTGVLVVSKETANLYPSWEEVVKNCTDYSFDIEVLSWTIE